MPDTPQFLLKCNRSEEAETSLRFYKNCKSGEIDDMKLIKEFEDLKAFIEHNSISEKLHLADFRMCIRYINQSTNKRTYSFLFL